MVRYLGAQEFELLRADREVVVPGELTAMTERKRRVNEAMRKVLSDAIPTLKDPRIGFVTVTGVEAATGFAHATVFVSVFGSEPSASGLSRVSVPLTVSCRHRSHASSACERTPV